MAGATGIKGPVRDQVAIRICTLSGIELLHGKIASLDVLRKSIRSDLAEVSRTAKRDNVLHAFGLGIKVTKIVCDTFFEVIGEVAGAKGKAGKGIYKTVDIIAQGVGRELAGESVNWAQQTSKAANEAVNTIAENKIGSLKNAPSDTIKGYKIAQKLNKTKTDVIIDAMSSDQKSLKKDAVKYFRDLAEETAGTVVSEKYMKVWKIGRSVILAGYDAAKAYDEFDGDYLSEKEIQNQKKSFSVSLMRIDALISKLDAEAKACEEELYQPEIILGKQTRQQRGKTS